MFRPMLRYAHQGGMNPPVIVIHGNQLDSLPDEPPAATWSASSSIRSGLQGTPVRIQFKVSSNPYAERR